MFPSLKISIPTLCDLTFTLIWRKLPTKLENKAFVGSPLCYARVFNSLIMEKMLTGLIKPVLFLSKYLSYYIAIFSNLCYNGFQEVFP